MTQITYAILSFTEVDLNSLFSRYIIKTLSKFRRTQALTNFLWKHSGYYFTTEAKKPNFNPEEDVSDVTQCAMNFIIGKITKKQFIQEFLDDKHFRDDLYSMVGKPAKVYTI